MLSKNMNTTSPLRQERNINIPPNSVGTGLGVQIVLFMESLLERGVESGIIVKFCCELRPFLEYIGNTGETGLSGRAVASYAATVCSDYEASEKTFTNALNASGLLSAVRLFCLYLYAAGMVPDDYSLLVPGIPFPDGAD